MKKIQGVRQHLAGQCGLVSHLWKNHPNEKLIFLHWQPIRLCNLNLMLMTGQPIRFKMGPHPPSPAPVREQAKVACITKFPSGLFCYYSLNPSEHHRVCVHSCVINSDSWVSLHWPLQPCRKVDQDSWHNPALCGMSVVIIHTQLWRRWLHDCAGAVSGWRLWVWPDGGPWPDVASHCGTSHEMVRWD